MKNCCKSEDNIAWDMSGYFFCLVCDNEEAILDSVLWALGGC